MFAKCDTVPNKIWGTCLFQESIPAILFWNSKHPLPTRTRSLSFLRAAVRSISSGLWLRHVHPFVAAAEKRQSHAEKQRVLPRCCRIEDLLRTIQWLCPKFGLQVFDCALRSGMWLPQTNKQLWRLSSLQPWVGNGATDLSAAHVCKMWHSAKRDLRDICLFKESIPAFFFWNSKHPLPTRTRSLSFLRAERSTSPAVWSYHAHAFLAAAEKIQSHAEKQRVWSRVCRVQDLFQYTVYWLCSSMTAAN